MSQSSPDVLYAMSSDSGSVIYIAFASPTNQAGISASSWSCGILLSFPYADTTLCSWQNSSAILISLASSNASLLPGDSIILSMDMIGAAGSSGVSTSAVSKMKLLNQLSIVISAPFNPNPPFPSVIIPSSVLSCAAFEIDCTQSVGSFGRNWESIKWTVSTSLTSATASARNLENLLNARYTQTTSALIIIPANILAVGRYYVTLTLVNVLKLTASRTVTFSVLNSSDVLPIVQIMGSTEQYYKSSDSLKLMTHLSFAYCDESLSSKASLASSVNLVWSCWKDGILESHIVSINSNPRIFELSPYTLQVDTVYQISVSASFGSASWLITNSTVTIMIQPGDIHPVVMGGTIRSISQDTTIDCKNTYDENSPSTATMSYSWSCSILSSSDYGETCNYIFGMGQLDEDQVTIYYLYLQTDVIYGVELICTTSDGRSNSLALSFTKEVVTNSYGMATIKSTFPIASVDNPLVVYGFVSAPVDITSSWRVLQGSNELDLQKRSNTPPARNFSMTNNASSFIPFPLSVDIGDLLRGSSLSFRLSTFQRDTGRLLSYSEISAMAAPAPVGGSISVSPIEGIGLITLFTFITSGWMDDSGSYPLQYGFHYIVSVQTPPIAIQMVNTPTVIRSTLPSGLKQNRFEVVVIARAVNVYGGTGSTFTTIVVTEPPSNMTYYAYMSYEQQNARNLSSMDALLCSACNVMMMMAAVNCSSAPQSLCASLNRSPCQTVPQTCSNCLEGFVGVVGPSNTLCSKATALLSPLGGACSADSDCYFNLCVDGICIEPRKLCPTHTVNTTCSGHGYCSYVINQVMTTVDNCGITNTGCKAKCQCEVGYSGLSCEFMSSDSADRTATLLLACQSLLEVIQSSSPSTSLLESLIASINVASLNVLAQDHDFDICLTALQTTTQLAALGYLNGSSVLAPGYLFAAVSNFVRYRSGNKAENETHLGDKLSHALTSFSQGILTTMVSGQFDQNFAGNNLRLVINRAFVQDIENLSFVAPKTQDEKAYGSLSATLTFLNGSLKQCNLGNGYSRTAFGLWSTVPYRSNKTIISSLARLEAFPNQSFVEAGEANSLPDTGQTWPRYSFTVPFSFSQSFTRRLTKTGQNVTFPRCQETIDGQLVNCSDCELSTYSNTTSVFLCYNIADLCPNVVDVNGEDSSTDRRQLFSLSGDDDGGQLNTPSSNLQQILAIVDYSERYFVEVLSFNPFRVDPEQAKPVVAVVGAMFMMIVLGFLYFARWDWDDHHQLIYIPPPSSSAMAKSKSCANQENKKNKLLSLLEGDQDSDDDGANQKKPLEEVQIEDVTSFLNEVLPLQRRLPNTFWDFVVNFARAVWNRHDMLNAFAEPSLSNPRSMRWLNLCLQLLVMIFFDTLVFNLFFPDEGQCESYHTKEDCLHPINKATGKALCSWTGSSSSDPTGDDLTVYSSVSCNVSGPPSDLTFTLLLALVTFMLSIPVALALDFVRLEICSKRPTPAVLSFFWSVPDDFRGLQDNTLVEKTFHQMGSGPKRPPSRPVPQRFSLEPCNFTDRDFHAKMVFDEQLPCSQEVDLLLNEIRSFLDHASQFDRINGGRGRSGGNAFSLAALPDVLTSIQRLAGIYIDGSPVQMTLRQRLWYGNNPRKRLESKIRAARRRAREIKAILFSIHDNDGRALDRSVALLQFFVIEQFSPLKRYVLRSQYFPFESFSPPPVALPLWIMGWTILLGAFAFFLYWILVWGLSSGNSATKSWGLNFVLVFVQDFILSQLFQIFVLQVLAMLSIHPQLRFIYHVLYRKARDVLTPNHGDKKQEEDQGDNKDEVTSVIQHLSSACRVGHMHSCMDLPASILLRDLTDADVELCRRQSHQALPLAATSFLLGPVLLTVLLGETFGEMALETLLPLLVFGFILANFYLLRVSLLFFILLYMAFVVVTLWKMLVVRPSVKQQHEEEGGREMVVSRSPIASPPSSPPVRVAVNPMHVIFRSGQSSLCSLLSYLSFKLPYTWYLYLVRGVRVCVLQKEERQKEEWREHWQNMNKPQALQGFTSSQDLGNNTQVDSPTAVSGPPALLVREISASWACKRHWAVAAFSSTVSVSSKRRMQASILLSLPEEVRAMRPDHWSSTWSLSPRREQKQEHHDDYLQELLSRWLHLTRPVDISQYREHLRPDGPMPPATINFDLFDPDHKVDSDDDDDYLVTMQRKEKKRNPQHWYAYKQQRALQYVEKIHPPASDPVKVMAKALNLHATELGLPVPPPPRLASSITTPSPRKPMTAVPPSSSPGPLRLLSRSFSFRSRSSSVSGTERNSPIRFALLRDFSRRRFSALSSSFHTQPRSPGVLAEDEEVDEEYGSFARATSELSAMSCCGASQGETRREMRPFRLFLPLVHTLAQQFQPHGLPLTRLQREELVLSFNAFVLSSRVDDYNEPVLCVEEVEEWFFTACANL
eukprot:scaffold3779_cov254-Ochromonas_danica.AAC.18